MRAREYLLLIGASEDPVEILQNPRKMCLDMKRSQHRQNDRKIFLIDPALEQARSACKHIRNSK